MSSIALGQFTLEREVPMMTLTKSIESPVQKPVFLVVDDLQENVCLIEQFINIQIEGAKTITTTDPEEGLAICFEEMPDIVILDIQMPVMTGIEMCKRIKSHKKTADIPVILMTGHYASAEYKVEGYEAGACDFITKPIEMPELIARVKSVLKTKWNEDRLKTLNQQLEKEIGKRKGIEQNLIEAKELAEKANSAKTEFISFVTHELRSHLHAIYSYSKLGITKADNMALDKHIAYYENIHDNATKVIELINDLLDLSKMEFGKMTYSMAKIDFQTILKSIISVFQSLLEEKGLTVNIENLCSDTTLVVDGQRIEQVVCNLVSNAIKFSPLHQSIDITISDGNENLGCGSIEALKLSVFNKGPKIKETELTSIFEKYTQCREGVNKPKGTGLGLAISREIMKAHGGKIWAENSEKGGVAFQVLIPKNQDLSGQQVQTKLN